MRINVDAILAAPAAISVSEARRLLGVSQTKIYRDIQEGRLETFGAQPKMVTKASLLDYVGLSGADLAGAVRSTAVFPVTIPLDNVFLVPDDEGNPAELWIGKPGTGRLFILSEVSD